MSNFSLYLLNLNAHEIKCFEDWAIKQKKLSIKKKKLDKHTPVICKTITEPSELPKFNFRRQIIVAKNLDALVKVTDTNTIKVLLACTITSEDYMNAISAHVNLVLPIRGGQVKLSRFFSQILQQVQFFSTHSALGKDRFIHHLPGISLTPILQMYAQDGFTGLILHRGQTGTATKIFMDDGFLVCCFNDGKRCVDFEDMTTSVADIATDEDGFISILKLDVPITEHIGGADITTVLLQAALNIDHEGKSE